MGFEFPQVDGWHGWIVPKVFWEGWINLAGESSCEIAHLHCTERSAVHVSGWKKHPALR
jgi:hypothetical protein